MTAISLGGLTIAIALVAVHLRTWWRKGTHDPKELLHGAAGMLLGLEATTCAGGALGWGSSGIAGLLSGAGDKGTHTLTGTGGVGLGHGSLGHLDVYGGPVVVVTLVLVIALYRSCPKNSAERKRIIGGILVGIVAGLLPGSAAVFQWVPSTCNAIGLAVVDFFRKS